MEKKLDEIQGLAAMRNPLAETRRALDLLNANRRDEAREVIDRVAEDDRRASRQTVAQAENK